MYGNYLLSAVEFGVGTRMDSGDVKFNSRAMRGPGKHQLRCKLVKIPIDGIMNALRAGKPTMCGRPTGWMWIHWVV